MAKVYDLTATLHTGHNRADAYQGDEWTGYYDTGWSEASENLGYAGFDYYWDYATNMLFDSATLNTLRTKTVTGVTLELNVTQAATGNFYIGYKLNGTANGGTNSNAWARSVNGGSSPSATSDSVATVDSPSFTSITTGTHTLTLKTAVPQYGLTAGSILGNRSRWRFSSAILHVTTNETDYSYTLVYDLKGGSGTFANQTGSNTLVSPSYTFSIYSSTPTKDGHTFLGWSTSSSATSASYSAGGSITVTSSGTTTLYAVWKVNTYTVSYNKGSYGSGTNTSDTKTYGVALTLKGAIFTRTGYTQTGWATSDGGAKAYDLSGSYTSNSAATLYPFWTANTYTVTYKPGSYSSGSNYTATKTYGVALTLRGATYTRSNYSQDGWSVNANGSTKDYNLSGSYTNNGATTLYPHWKADTYTVSYNANGGSDAPAAQTKTYGVNLTLQSGVPTRTNYIFLGWATSSTGAVAYQPGGTYSTNAAVTLYAIWQAAKSTLSTITSSVNIGSSGTASWNIVNTAYTYTLVITYSNAPAVTVNVSANTSSTSFTIPATWYAYLPNVTSVTATATLTTYSGSTSLGSTTKTFTVAVASTVTPTISSFTHSPYAQNSVVNGWGQQYGTYVQGYSQVDLSVSASAGTGASIISIAFSGAGVSQSSTATTARSSVLSNTGYITYSVTVTDSRNRSVTSTMSGNNRPYFYEYNVPVISTMTAFRCNQSGTADAISGTYINTTAKFSLSSCGGRNTFSVRKIEYKLHTASSWTSGVATATSEQAYTIGNGNIAITSSYDVRCTVTDALSHTTTYVVLVPPIVGFSVGLNNDRARFGGPVEKAGLQVDWDAEFNGVVDVTPRRCYASLPTSGNVAGWYKVIDFTGWSSSSPNWAVSLAIDFTILRAYNNNNNEIHKISFIARYNNMSFVNETSSSQTLLIDKIRYVRDGNNGHFDIHYASTSSNNCYVDFLVHFDPTVQDCFSAVTPTKVDDSPVSPATVLTEYSFAANTDGTGTITAGTYTGTLSIYYLYRQGKIVTGHVNLSLGSTAAAGGWRNIAVVPSGFKPLYNVDFNAVDNASDESIHARIYSATGNIDIYPSSDKPSGRNILLAFTYYTG